MGMGATIKSARLQRGWNQEDLAKRMSTLKSTVSRWEADKAIPPFPKLKMLASELGVPVEELLGTQEASPKPPTPSDISSLDPLLIATWKSMSQRQRKKLLQIAIILSQD